MLTNVPKTGPQCCEEMRLRVTKHYFWSLFLPRVHWVFFSFSYVVYILNIIYTLCLRVSFEHIVFHNDIKETESLD